MVIKNMKINLEHTLKASTMLHIIVFQAPLGPSSSGRGTCSVTNHEWTVKGIRSDPSCSFPQAFSDA